MRRGPHAGWLLGAALSLCLAVSASPAPAAPQEPLRAAGRWILDGSGRVVVFHGVNLVPPGPGGTPESFGIDERHLRFLRRQGFRLVRLGAFYADIEPQPGAYNRRFMTALGRYARKIAAQGMFVQLDIHQDLFSARMKGRGFPEWMALDDGLPVEPNPGFPGGYFTSPAANRAYDNFWADREAVDGIGVQTHFARGWRRLARRFSRLPRIVGYDIFNEPWPGSAWPACANPIGCPPGGFDQTSLTRFSRRIADAIRGGDRRRIVFAEPNLMFDVGADTGLGDIRDPNPGLSFHDYCLGAAPGLPAVPDPLSLCEIGEQRVVDNALRYSRRTGAALLLTEFSDTKNPVVARRVTDILDRNMIGWAFWSYWAANGQILRNPERPPVAGNLEQPLLDAVVRPYPYLIAGTPLAFGFQRGSRVFTLVYSTAPVGRRLLRRDTEIVLPRRVYPQGRYRLQLSGASVVSARRRPVLRIRNQPGAKQVRLRISPLPARG